MSKQKTGKYSGRLSWDHDAGMHAEMILGKPYKGEIVFDRDRGLHVTKDGEPLILVDGEWRTQDQPGQHVVTEDGGKTWRYAESGDTSHRDRYEQRALMIDSTANRMAELAIQAANNQDGVPIDVRTQLLAEQPHHFEVTPNDPHFAGVRSDPDHEAEKVTSHTDAWAEED